VLGIGVGTGGGSVLAQSQYPASAPSSGYGSVVPPPPIPQAPSFVAPGQIPSASSTVVPAPIIPLPPGSSLSTTLNGVGSQALAPKTGAPSPLPMSGPMYVQQPMGPTMGPDSPAIQALIDQRIKLHDEEVARKKKADDDAKAAEAAARGTEVVNNVPLSVTWNNSVWFSGADNAFRVRLGGYGQYDTSHWIQDPKTLPPAFGGNGAANEGQFENGIFVRRARIEFEGTLWENFEFQFYPEFEGVNRLQYDEFWFGLKEIPILGSIRFGKDKIPTSMESVGSSKDVWFMERSENFDTFNSEFGLGLFWIRNYFNERMSSSAWVGKWDISEFSYNEGDYFDNNGYAAAIRITGLPIYEGDGRYLVHLGCSFQYRQPNLDSGLGVFAPAPAAAAVASSTGASFFRFRARPDMRDAVGIGALTNSGGLGNTIIGYGDGDGTRLVDTGLISGQNVCMVTPEFMVYWGRFALLSEGSLNWVSNASSINATTGAATPIGNQFYWGWYAQASCFLTGEQRTYNKRYGTYARVIPNENAWLVRDEDGNFNGGLGAWEVLFRYDYINVNVVNNTLPGAPGIVGGSGIMNSYTAGVNWHINPNCRLMFNYTVAGREMQAAAGNAILQGIGTRVHFQF